MFQPYLAKKTAIVNLKSGKAFKGFIRRVAWPYLVLSQVEVFNNKDPLTSASKKVDGKLVVAVADVDFIQLPNV